MPRQSDGPSDDGGDEQREQVTAAPATIEVTQEIADLLGTVSQVERDEFLSYYALGVSVARLSRALTKKA